MSDPKSLTELAMSHKREAYIERACKDPPVLAEMWDREAAKLLTLPEGPEIGPGGEVVAQRCAPDLRVSELARKDQRRLAIRNTLEDGATRIAEEASIRRTELLMQPNFDLVAGGIDAADSINAGNSLEKMLAHQMAAAHEASMRLLNRAMIYVGHETAGRSIRDGEPVEACRLTNAAARLMSVYQDATLTLQRLRTGGNQTVTVQHVNVAAGAQAVIGNVQTGGRKRGGNKLKDG